ncbi:MAG: peptidase T [Ectothiorhodospiraceae bacterium]|nr:peptidase T [Ectothiorhodospiraceae bacterium]
MIPSDITFSCVDRFLKYVKYDTQSQEDSSTFPSTLKQKVLGEELVKELKEIGLQDVEMDEYGYVTGTLPATTDKENVPVIGFIAHMDTSPEVSGKDVKPVLHENYDGKDIVLPEDPEIVISVDHNPDLKDKVGETIITADGTTLLGADNKAGIAEIFDAMQYLVKHPEIKHGKIRVCITPDEEVGQGTKFFNVEKFGADYAYTVDGEQLGTIENETFCADSITFTFKGVNIHPGFAKDRLVNSIKVAAAFLDSLPKDRLSPETTEKKEPYVHPYVLNGGIEETMVKMLLRSFETEELREEEAELRSLADAAVAKFPKSSVEVKVEESYRNMRFILDDHPYIMENAKEAMERIGIEPHIGSIRGGTDGSRLSYMGLPCPNIFAGEHSFHSKTEWVSVQDMQKAVLTVINIAMIWEEKA